MVPSGGGLENKGVLGAQMVKFVFRKYLGKYCG